MFPVCSSHSSLNLTPFCITVGSLSDLPWRYGNRHATRIPHQDQCLKEFGLDKASGLFAFPGWYTIKNCQILVKNLNFVAGMTRRFVSAKRLIQYFSNSSKLVEHRAQSPVDFANQDVKSLALYRRRIPNRMLTSYIQ